MSAPETPIETEWQIMLAKQDQILQQQAALIDALNGLGANVQWIIDNVQGIFQMFANPAFMAQLPGMMGGMAGGSGDAAEPAGN